VNELVIAVLTMTLSIYGQICGSAEGSLWVKPEESILGCDPRFSARILEFQSRSITQWGVGGPAQGEEVLDFRERGGKLCER